jgi:predicted P-loop ATPase
MSATKIYEEEAFVELDLLFETNEKGKKEYIQNTENIYRILANHHKFKDRFRYDEFRNEYQIKPTKTNKWRQLEDNDAVLVQTAISVAFPSFARVRKEMVYDAIIKVSKENAYDSARDYIASLKWDKTPRLDTWLCKTYGVEDNVYHKAVASNWIKGFVKRLIDPGCKFDYVLVLEGEQGVRKSTSLATLGGDWHVETTMSTDSKDFFMQFQGKAIIEFSEGETLSRTEVKRMKAIITMQYDKYRPPYERTSKDFPRRCVFAMTTNESKYLKDDTGNRRWLPVKVVLPKADVEWLALNREQLFAEAYHRLTVLKETAYEMPEDETRAEQEDRLVENANHDLVIDWYMKLTKEEREEGVTVAQAYSACFGNTFNKKVDYFLQTSITHVFKKMLFLEQGRVMEKGQRSRKYFKTYKTPTLLNKEEISINDFNI